MSAPPPRGFRVGPEADPDRYVLGPAVASGAEGILYRGSILTSTGVQLDVAIKMLQPRFLPQVDEWHARWSEQVELLRSLQVPGVVRVRDGFLGPLPHGPGEAGEDRTLYLIMNWVEGEPLDEWVRRRPDRDPLDALKLLLGVAAALDLMHSGRATGGVPVVHRDVKPANIVVTDEGSVLVDFGLTRGLPVGQRLSGVSGTPGYLPPEATEAGIYTAATDRYAFGGVSYFVLTGIEPPPTHDPDTMRAVLSAIPVMARLPSAVDHLMAMVDADPAARPASLSNWIGQLRQSSLSGLPDMLAPEAPSRKAPPTLGARRRRGNDRGRRGMERWRRLGPRARVLALAAPVAAVVSVGAVLVVGQWRDSPPLPARTTHDRAKPPGPPGSPTTTAQALRPPGTEWLAFAFDDLPLGTAEAGRPVTNTPKNGNDGVVRTAMAGEITVLTRTAPGDNAVKFPDPCTSPPATCPRAIVQTPDPSNLRTGVSDFTYGADIAVQRSEVSPGATIVQKGRPTQDGDTEWRLQLEADGRPSCVAIEKGTASYTALSPVSIADGRWHRVRCTRTAGELEMEVDDLTHSRASLPAHLEFNSPAPVRLGGNSILADNGQFSGALDNVFLRLGS